MPSANQISFTQLLKRFKKNFKVAATGTQPRLVLILMANTHDKSIGRECAMDMKAVNNVFKNISRHFKFPFCSIEVAGRHYGWHNLSKAIEAITMPDEAVMDKLDDVVIFYYTGHGFSYKNDGYTKYPQLDIRPHNTNADFNSLHFIKQQTISLESILNLLRLRGGKINIAIGDCCNTTIPSKRPGIDEWEMWASGKILPPKCKKLTPKMLTDDKKEISIIVSSSQFGQPAVTDKKMGSLFTHFFTKALVAVLNTSYKGEPYIPWIKVLETASARAFKESKGYDVGGGVAGKQKAVFQPYVSNDVTVAKRLLSMIRRFEALKKIYQKKVSDGVIVEDGLLSMVNRLAKLRKSLEG